MNESRTPTNPGLPNIKEALIEERDNLKEDLLWKEKLLNNLTTNNGAKTTAQLSDYAKIDRDANLAANLLAEIKDLQNKIKTIEEHPLNTPLPTKPTSTKQNPPAEKATPAPVAEEKSLPLHTFRKNKWMQALGFLAATTFIGHFLPGANKDEKPPTGHSETASTPAPDSLPASGPVKMKYNSDKNGFVRTPTSPDRHSYADLLQPDEGPTSPAENPILAETIKVEPGNNPWNLIEKTLNKIPEFQQLQDHNKEPIITYLDNLYLKNPSKYSSDGGKFLSEPTSFFKIGRLIEVGGLEKIKAMIEKVDPTNPKYDKKLDAQFKKAHEERSEAVDGKRLKPGKTLDLEKAYPNIGENSIDVERILNQNEIGQQRLLEINNSLLPQLAQLQKTHDIKFVKDSLGRYALDAGWFGAGKRRWDKYVAKGDATVFDVGRLVEKYNDIKLGKG